MVEHSCIDVGPTHLIWVRRQPMPDILDPQDRQPRLVGEVPREVVQVAQLVAGSVGQPHGNIDLPAVTRGGGVPDDEVVALILRLARGAARPRLLPVEHFMDARVGHDRSQCLEHAVGTRVWAARANVEIAPDHQARDRTADMFGMAESTEVGYQSKVSQHLAGLRLEQVLALEQFGRVGRVERARVHTCASGWVEREPRTDEYSTKDHPGRPATHRNGYTSWGADREG
jgi:hypothetical protein